MPRRRDAAATLPRRGARGSCRRRTSRPRPTPRRSSATRRPACARLGRSSARWWRCPAGWGTTVVSRDRSAAPSLRVGAESQSTISESSAAFGSSGTRNCTGPTRSRSPPDSRRTPRTGESLMNVPLRLPRSSTFTPAFETINRQWWRLTSAVASRIGQSSSRPISVSPSAKRMRRPRCLPDSTISSVTAAPPGAGSKAGGRGGGRPVDDDPSCPAAPPHATPGRSGGHENPVFSGDFLDKPAVPG